MLKGPQGTLYGGSNIGGAVKFVSAWPVPNLHALDGGENINIGTMGQPRLVAASLSYRF